MCYSPTLRSLPGKLGDPFVSFGLPSVLGSTSFHVRIRMALAGGHKSWKNNLTLTLSESSTGRVKSGRWVWDKLPTGKAMRNQFLVQSPKVEGSSQSVASGTFHVEADTIIARREIPTAPSISLRTRCIWNCGGTAGCKTTTTTTDDGGQHPRYVDVKKNRKRGGRFVSGCLEALSVEKC